MDVPWRETPESLAEEEKIRAKIEKITDRMTLKLDRRRYFMDCVLVERDPSNWGAGERSRDIVGLLEVKRRFNRVGDYPTFMIDAMKLEAVSSLAQYMRVRATAWVQWDDDLGFLHLTSRTGDLLPHCNWKATVGGRWDRGDVADIDLLLHVPTSEFTFLGVASNADAETAALANHAERNNLWHGRLPG